MAIPLSLLHLRSQLQYLNSSEFNNLTITELKDGTKFPLFERIFTVIIQQSPILKEHDVCLQLLQLIDKKKKTLKYLQKKEIGEYEYDYKLHFMTIIQTILILLQWPLACEPFADILTPLMNDHTFVLSAIEFILLSNDVPHTRRDRTIPIITTSASGKSIHPNKSISKISSSEKRGNKCSEDSEQINVSITHELEPKKLATKGNISDSNECSKHDFTADAFIALKKSFSILQYHNEMLTDQLRNISESICIRDEFEDRMENIMKELLLHSKDSVEPSITSPTTTSLTDTSEKKPPSRRRGYDQIAQSLAQWSEVRRDLKRRLLSKVDIDINSKFYKSDTTGSTATSSSHGTIRLAQVLGVHPQMIALISDDRSSDTEHRLDICEVHALQRDLVHLAESATSAITSLTPHSSNCLPFEAFHTQQIATNLSESACSLLLRLSRYAPLAGPALTTQHPSALHALIQEILRTAGTRGIQPSCQNAIDRSLSELQTLVHAYDMRGKCLEQWGDVYKRIIPYIDKYGIDAMAVTHHAMEDLRTLEGSVGCVSLALDEAESDRIDDPKRGTKINPLDALSRGVMGACTGNLINALRMQAPCLRNISMKIAEFRRDFTREINKSNAAWKTIQTSLAAGSNASSLIANEKCWEHMQASVVSSDSTVRPISRGSSGTRRRSADFVLTSSGGRKATSTEENRPAWAS